MTLATDIDDLPLKRSQETFVDDPTELKDVVIDSLLFDLRHGLKDINNLHIFHALALFNTTLTNIMTLQSDPPLMNEFRNDQFKKYGLNINDAVALQGQRPNAPLTSENMTIGSPDITPILERINADVKPELISTRSDDHREPLPLLKSNSLSNNFNELGNDFVCSPTLNVDLSVEKDLIAADLEELAGCYVPIEDLVSKDDVQDNNKNQLIEFERLKMRKELEASLNVTKFHQGSDLLKFFNLVKPPQLSIQDFLLRIKTYSSSMSVLVYVNSAFLIFKLSVLLNVVTLTELNVHRLILGLVRCLVKMLEDLHQKQKTFAAVGGVANKDLLRIEVGFLYLCNFRMDAGESVLNCFLHEHFPELHEVCKAKNNGVDEN